jgi:putative peptide zinc metalloprotease protein
VTAADAALAGAVLPARHPEVVLGPRCVTGWRRQHLVGLPGGDRVLTLGELEFRVLSLLDGTTTVGRVADEVSATTGAPLTPERLGRLVAVFAARGLLDPPTPAAPPGGGAPAVPPGGSTPAGAVAGAGAGAVATAPAGRVPRPRRTLLRAAWETVHAARLLGPLLSVARALLSRGGALVSVPLVLLALVQLVTRAPEIVSEARAAVASPPVAVVWVLALALSLAIHEAGHALACLRWGGRVRAVGLRWRLPLLVAYADVPGYQLLPRLGQRLSACFAGVWTSLLLLVPVAAAWRLLDGTGPAGVLAAVQLGLVVSSVVNLVPVAGSDGYRMLEQAVGVRNLSRTSTDVLLACATPAGRADLRRQRPALVGLYVGYGLFCLLAVLVTGALVLSATTWAAHQVLGRPAALAVGGVVLAAMLAGTGIAVARTVRTPPAAPAAG